MSRSIEIQWRQGDLLSPDALKTTGIFIDANNIAIVISHDCDIANNETHVECILGDYIPKEKYDGNKVGAKNPRSLHLNIGNTEKIIELNAAKKFIILKEILKNYRPSSEDSLNANQRAILQEWLSVRYKRQAIPDALKDRLNPLWKFLEKKGKKHTDDILAYWIQYDPKNEELDPSQPYDFSLFVIYSISNLEYMTTAKSIVDEIKAEFSNILKNTTTNLGSVHLLNCEAYSEEEFTLADMRRNVHYRFEYLSYRTDPHGPVV